MRPRVEILGLFERLEDPLDIIGGDAGTAIDDPDLGSIAVHGDLHDDLAVVRRERERVLDELLHDAQAGRAVQRGHHGSGRCLDPDPGVALGRLAGERDHVGPLGQARLDGCLETVHETGEPLGALRERAQGLVELLALHGSPLEGLRQPEDHRHRGPQLVAQAADQLLAPRGALQQRLLRQLELPGAPTLAFESLGQLFDHGGGDRRREQRPAGGRPLDRPDDLVAVGVLQDVARGTGDEHVSHRALLLDAGERDDPQGRTERLQAPGRLDAVHHGHPHIHEDHVGSEGADELHGLQAGTCLADHREVLALEQGGQGITEGHVVVHHQDPNRDGHRRGRGRLHPHDLRMGAAYSARHPADARFASVDSLVGWMGDTGTNPPVSRWSRRVAPRSRLLRPPAGFGCYPRTQTCPSAHRLRPAGGI